MKKIKFLVFVLLVTSITLISCESENINQLNIMGKWISTDKNDTLNFVDNNNFYKNGDHFNYRLDGDLIEVKYNGKLFVLVNPTKHRYSLDDNVLIIDFSNEICYGFDLQKVTYVKK
jgi:hypothetical protein